MSMTVCSAVHIIPVSTASLALWLRRPLHEWQTRGSLPACTQIPLALWFFQVEPYHLKNGTPVATLQGAWRYRVSAGTGWPCASILWLGEIECLICSFSVWQHIWAGSSIRYTSMLLDVKQLTNNKSLHDMYFGWMCFCLYLCIMLYIRRQYL